LIFVALTSEVEDILALAAAPNDAAAETVPVASSVAIGEDDALLATVCVDLCDRAGVKVWPSDGPCLPVNAADGVALGSIDDRLSSLAIGEPLARALPVRKCVELSAGKTLRVCP
jgi:hypothetical protein